jgi:hypothetical protein
MADVILPAESMVTRGPKRSMKWRQVWQLWCCRSAGSVKPPRYRSHKPLASVVNSGSDPSPQPSRKLSLTLVRKAS